MMNDIELLEEDGLTEEDLAFPEKEKRRAVRRKNTWNKIRRVEYIAYRTWNGTSQKSNEMFLGHRAAKRNPLKYYVCRWKMSEKNTLAREERVRDALREEEREAA